jgi:PTH1 family peptidyl-tRNA hydrolase
MDQQLGSQDYWRARLGIGHPGSKERVLGHVLGDFSREDEHWLLPFLGALGDAAPLLAADRIEDFMTRVAFLTKAAPGKTGS